MGWIVEQGADGHEGFLCAFVEREPRGAGLFRELAAGLDVAPRTHLARVSVGCDCGWRSPYLVAPPGIAWQGIQPAGLVHVPEGFEETARALWRVHVSIVGGLVASAAGVGGVDLFEREAAGIGGAVLRWLRSGDGVGGDDYVAESIADDLEHGTCGAPLLGRR